ncbi:hypothetical protein L9F63_012683, partial [Diploptera punctata]
MVLIFDFSYFMPNTLYALSPSFGCIHQHKKGTIEYYCIQVEETGLQEDGESN